jgi:hypothetical protein
MMLETGMARLAKRRANVRIQSGLRIIKESADRIVSQ